MKHSVLLLVMAAIVTRVGAQSKSVLAFVNPPSPYRKFRFFFLIE